VPGRPPASIAPLGLLLPLLGMQPGPPCRPHAEQWQQQAERRDGSWWPAWHEWLAARSGRSVRAKPIPAGVAIADAPGTFALKRYAD